MSSTLQNTAAAWPSPRSGLMPRLAAVAAILAVETLLISYLIQGTTTDDLTGAPLILRNVQHWFFRFAIVYAVVLGMLVHLRGRRDIPDMLPAAVETSIRLSWLIVHIVLLLPFAVLSKALYSGSLPLPFAALAVGWHLLALGAALALFAAAAPLASWLRLLRSTGILPLYAFGAATAAVLAIRASQLLWKPTAHVTFSLVALLLRPLLPALHADYGTLTVSTARFAVTVSEICSGLEGVGLMLAFCATWLWYFRREYRFPRALLIVPAALLLVFILNAIRIAALVIIGDAGYPGIAIVGFHSQAGWIAFNLAALAVALVAKHSSWMRRETHSDPIAATPTANDATAAFLTPLLAILAAGMVAHAMSSGFELLYPLRWVAAVAVLWAYRRRYAELDWRASWRGPLVGVAVAIVWYGFARYLIAAAPKPDTLREMPATFSAAWIGLRALAASTTVPIAEELAYRGYLMRRLAGTAFNDIPFGAVRWPALLVASVAFGITHGSMWLPGIIAGIAYGALAIHTQRLGEAVAAHATTNALLAVLVLLFDQWQLW